MHLSREKYVSYIAGLLVSLTIFSGILLTFGYSPILSLQSIAYGAFGSIYSVSETLVRVPPLLLSALAFLVGFKARFYNIGIEGQIYMGALATYLVSTQLASLPSFISITLMALAAFAGGTAWLAVPLFMRIKLQLNELFPTLVMNFIAVLVISWLTTGPIKDPNANNPQTQAIPSSEWLPILIPGTRLHIGVLFAIALSLVVFLIIYKTVLGFEIRASGLSPRAAQQGGVSLSRSVAAVGLLSGGLAGLAGMFEVAGASHLLAQGFSPGFGYQGIGIAALGSFHPIGALFASFLYSILQIGGETMQRGAGVPIEMIFILQATIVLSVLVVQRLVSGRR